MRDEHAAVGTAAEWQWQRARAHNISLARTTEAAQEPRSVRIAPARRSGLGAPSALGSVGSLACLVGKTGRRGWRVLADLLHRTCGAEGMESPCGGSALLIPYSCGRLSGGRTHGCGVPRTAESRRQVAVVGLRILGVFAVKVL